MKVPEAPSTFTKMAAFYQCIKPDPSELEMISTRVMDIKLREAAEGLGEDSTGKKKSKFKTFKKFFGKKKRKESPSSTGGGTWKQSQAKNEVIAIESGPVGYDSEDELEESRGALGSRALSHDSIFIPESGQDPARPVRVFSQENVCDRIKALQVSVASSSPPQSPHQLFSRHASDTSVSPRTLDSARAPVADFAYPPESSSCLDNSAAKHKLLVKPRNQRSSKMRRLSSRAQSESLSDLTGTPEEEEYDEKPLPKVSTEEKPSSGQQEAGPDRGPEPGGLATMLPPPGGARARRRRLQHCPALSASIEEDSLLGDNPSSHPATPEVTEAVSGPASLAESPSGPEGSPHPNHREDQREELSQESTCSSDRDTADEVDCASGDAEGQLSPCILDGDTAPPEPGPATTLETLPSPHGPDHTGQKEGKAKARSAEQLSSKPPLPRKPLLQTLTLPQLPAPPDTSPGDLDPRKENQPAERKSPHRAIEKAAEPGSDGQPTPPWVTVGRQKRRGAPEKPPSQEDKPGARTLKSETGRAAKAPERAQQEPVKQAEFVRSKSFLMAPAKPTADQRPGAKLRLPEGLQRGISLSHQNLAAQSAGEKTEKELHQLKRASYASMDQPSWMELARKKSQAWSDMPQIIK
ncbi:hypothetical protein CB1_001577037 [Camelus ferus]|nr:hypothetical protein CB1_001577037 [Camelus ferus]